MAINEKIIEELLETNPATKAELDAFKRQIAKKYRIPYPSNVDLLNALKSNQGQFPGRLAELLRVRPIRSLSGIVNVSVLTKPYPCPGNCLYCPNEPGFPKSYLSGEPAAERAKNLNFDPYLQVSKRLEMLESEGHNTDKVELRIIGATWSFYPKAYQNRFINQCFKACNEMKSAKGKQRLLEQEQKRNESAKCRIVGISVETRPDYINGKEILNLRKLGVTRVELGVQSIYDDVLELNRRGHKIDATIKATRLLKDAGFKVSYQIMLNLPGSSPKRDLEMAKGLFSDSDFCPDLIKIYPCAILKEAPLYEFYKQGKYEPYSQEELIRTIKEIKKIVPPWVRIERIIRDIPSPRITGGGKDISNLRQVVEQDMQTEGWHCQCIRCREIKGEYSFNEDPQMVRRDYKASGGHEIFLSFEDKSYKRIFSLLRLRIFGEDSKPLLGELKGSALIREIHTYGFQIPIGQKADAAQHRGLGKKLIKEAERIAATEFNLKKISAISGVGARAYWRKSGYRLKKTYMTRLIN